MKFTRKATSALVTGALNVIFAVPMTVILSEYFNPLVRKISAFGSGYYLEESFHNLPWLLYGLQVFAVVFFWTGVWMVRIKSLYLAKYNKLNYFYFKENKHLFSPMLLVATFNLAFVIFYNFSVKTYRSKEMYLILSE